MLKNSQSFSPFKIFTISASWLWLSIFALLPMMMVIAISLMSNSIENQYHLPWTFEQYRELFHSLYFMVFLRSIEYAIICTSCCLLVSYPFAYLLCQAPQQAQNIMLLLVIVPFWTSSLIRTYAIMAILKTKGLLNTFLLKLGLIATPLQLLYTNTALIIGLIYTLIPFMILPLYANMNKLDHSLVDAARDLGANRWTIFRKVLLPQTMPGILSGIMMVFLPAMTLFYLPSLLGGSKSLLLGNLIVLQYLNANNWPLGSATSVCLMALMILMLIYYWRHTRSSDRRNFL